MKPALAILALPIMLAATSALAQTTDQASSSIDVQQTGEAATAHIVNRDFVSYRPGSTHHSWTETGCVIAVFEWQPKPG